MVLFLIKRFLTLIATLIGTSVIVFLVLEILPGDPALTMMGIDAPESAVKALREELGLNEPAAIRYVTWITGLFQGDMGLSYTYRSPVSEIVLERFRVTLPLALMAMTFTIIISFSLGLFAASRHNKIGDYGVMGFSQMGIAIPDFWLGILLIVFFAVNLGWFSAGGFVGWEDGPGPALKSLLLPSLTLAFSLSGILTRIIRSSILEVVREDFARTARAKGLSQRATLWGHVLRNAMIPVITILGLLFANLLGGTIIVENVFSLPGIGKLIVSSISGRDLMVLKNVVLMLSAMVVTMNFIVDVLYGVIDPRIRLN